MAKVVTWIAAVVIAAVAVMSLLADHSQELPPLRPLTTPSYGNTTTPVRPTPKEYVDDSTIDTRDS